VTCISVQEPWYGGLPSGAPKLSALVRFASPAPSPAPPSPAPTRHTIWLAFWDVGLLFASPHLRTGEVIVSRKFANHFQATGRAVGGRLIVTDKRVIFQPHRLDSASGGQWWEVRLADVSSIGETPPGLGPNNLRTSLWLDVKSSDNEYFLVNGLHDVIRRLTEATGRPLGDRVPRPVGPTFRPPLVRWSPIAVLVATSFS
jgi:hypothetical protein